MMKFAWDSGFPSTPHSGVTDISLLELQCSSATLLDEGTNFRAHLCRKFELPGGSRFAKKRNHSSRLKEATVIFLMILRL